MVKYVFKGSVYVQGYLADDGWKAETFAQSDAKALSNIKYQYKKKNYINIRTPVDLRGSLIAER